MRWALIAVLALAGCAKGPDAEARYAIFDGELHSIKDECLEARKVADAYLSDNNQKEYRLWNASAGSTCLLAELRPGQMMRAGKVVPGTE